MSVKFSDLELILQWQGGDEKAFEILYKRYAVELIGIALSKTGSREVAEEIIQEVFLGIFLRRKSADQIRNLGAFLHTMVKNKVLDHYRRNLLFRKYECHSLQTQNSEDHTTLQLIEVRELEQQLALEVEKLPIKCRKVFELSRMEHLPNKEIAALLNISENTVEQHMRRALRILRSGLSQSYHSIVPLYYLITALIAECLS